MAAIAVSLPVAVVALVAAAFFLRRRVDMRGDRAQANGLTVHDGALRWDGQDKAAEFAIYISMKRGRTQAETQA
ncbi:MAG: hypothetical protein IPL88_10890 [Rhizobiales bacterium]|nr:hypothetical protein [Hyphomicrobiales bacterium]